MCINASLAVYESSFIIIQNAATFCVFAFDNKGIQSSIMQKKVLFIPVIFLCSFYFIFIRPTFFC